MLKTKYMYNTSNLNTQSSKLPCFKYIMLYDDYTSKVLTIVNNNVLNHINNFTGCNYILYTVITKYTLIRVAECTQPCIYITEYTQLDKHCYK